MNGRGCVPVQLHLQTQVAGQTWPAVYSLPVSHLEPLKFDDRRISLNLLWAQPWVGEGCSSQPQVLPSCTVFWWEKPHTRKGIIKVLIVASDEWASRGEGTHLDRAVRAGPLQRRQRMRTGTRPGLPSAAL